MDEVVRMDRGGALAAPVAARVYEGVAARVHNFGDGLDYGTYKQYRDHDELALMAAQFPGKPLLLDHPMLLLKDGGRGRQIGFVAAARVEDGKLIVKLVVDHADGESVIQDGMHALSAGYACSADANGYQHNTYVDHLAVVPRARCGPACRMRADRADCADTGTCACTPQPGVQPDCGCATAGADHAPCTSCANAVISPVMTAVAHEDAKLSAAERHHLPGSMFAIPGREGMPLEDAGHVKDAMARFDQEHWKGPAERKAAYHHIIARAHQLGIDPSGFEKKHAGKLDDDDTMDDDEDTMDAPNKMIADPAKSVKDDDDGNVLKIKTTLDAALQQLAAQTARADSAEKERDAALTAKTAAEIVAREAAKDAKILQTRVDSADADIKAAKDEAATKIAAAEAATKTHLDSAFQANVAARVDVLKNADIVLGTVDKDNKPFEHAKKSDRDIKVEIARHVDGEDAVLDTDSEDAINASYRGALKRHTGAKASKTGALVAIEQMRADNKPVLSGSERERAAKLEMQRQAEVAWNTRK